MRKGSVRFKIEEGERMSVRLKGAAGRGFDVHLVGPGHILAVRTKSKEGQREKQMSMNAAALADWYRDRGDETLNLDYPLNEKSTVVEVGCYEGLWSSRMAARYDCYIQNFEPIKSFFNAAKERFKNNPKVTMFNFGLSDKYEEVEFALDDDKSRPGSAARTEKVQLYDVAEYITNPVDLININIEGGEYVLLHRMLETGAAKLCQNIQVQFHDDYPNCVELRNALRAKLSETHTETYNYPFVWESWRIK